MKRIYTISWMALLILCSQFTAKAQCFSTLGGNETMVPNGFSDTSAADGLSRHLLCYNSYLYYFDNNPDTIYMESSSQLKVASCWNVVIYMKNNCQLRIDTAIVSNRIRTIFYDPAFTFFIDTTYAIIDSMVACPGLDYNYANFPGGQNPCTYSSVEEIAGSLISLYPNPGSDKVNIHFAGALSVGIVRSYKISGELIFESGYVNGNEYLMDISGWAKGFYLFDFVSDKSVTRHKFVKVQ